MKLLNVNKSYGDKVVLQNFSAEYPRGKHIAVMGRSGCGKSTLIRLLLGLEAPDSGGVIGEDGRYAAVFQEDRLSEPLSALQNVRLGRRGATKAEAAALLRDLGLGESMQKSVNTLSGGMRRRVAIARALIADADTVFLDEPFSALDGETKREVIAYVKERLSGKTVLLVTHDREEAQTFADEIFFFPAD